MNFAHILETGKKEFVININENMCAVHVSERCVNHDFQYVIQRLENELKRYSIVA